jgi:hypothetical protein
LTRKNGGDGSRLQLVEVDMKSAFMFAFGLGSALAGALLAAVAIAFVFPAGFHYSQHAAHHQAHQIAAIPFCGNASGSDQSSFYSEIAEVNERMHEGMAVASTGDVNRDFIRMMIPHHRGAIDMALVLLRHAPDERLRRLAQSIVVEQEQEITYMRLLDSNLPTTTFSSLPISNQ